MRNLVLFLVLANLGALAWFGWFRAAPTPGPRFDGPGITLLREADPDAAILSLRPTEEPSDTAPVALEELSLVVPANDSTLSPDQVIAETESEAIESEADAAAPVAFSRCIAIGPFTEPDVADSAQATLIEAGFEPGLTIVEEEVWAGYWVYIERVDSLEEAQAIDAELDENGIEEAYVIADSESGNLISLGVFSETARAVTQADRVGRLGYTATIADSTRLEETRWLEINLNGDETVELDSLQAPGRISRLEERDCTGSGP